MRIALLLTLVIVVAGCQMNHGSDPVSSSEKDADDLFGSATIMLPTLSQLGLAKTTSGPPVIFELSISGTSMATINKQWNIAMEETTVVVENIPAGPDRIFFGTILQEDALIAEGADTVAILPGKTAEVNLYMITDGGATVNIIFDRTEVIFSQEQFNDLIESYVSQVVDFDELDVASTSTIASGATEFEGNYYSGEGIEFSSDYDFYLAAGNSSWNESNSLSVGRFPNDNAQPYINDDDVTITLNPPVHGFGFTVVESINRSDESVTFYDIDGKVIKRVAFTDGMSSLRMFIGLLSYEKPIATVVIDESSEDMDDVNYDDFIFAY